MEESTVLYEYDVDQTVNSRTAGAHRKRRHVSQAYYIFLSHDFEVSCCFQSKAVIQYYIYGNKNNARGSHFLSPGLSKQQVHHWFS